MASANASAAPLRLFGVLIWMPTNMLGQDEGRGSKGSQVNRLAGLAMKGKPSVDFSGYWQRHQAANG